MESKRLISDLLNRIRLLTVKQKEPYLLFHKILGYYPNQIDLYQEALRHKSLSVRSSNGSLINNERLEYLGDAVLNVIVADILFKKYPGGNEDFLTKTRSKIVQRQSLNKVAQELGLDKMIISVPQASQGSRHSIYGNALEALIGAIYLDQGYRRCKRFIERSILGHHIDLTNIIHTEENHKSILLEWSQHEKYQLDLLTSDILNEQNKVIRFRAEAKVEGISIGSGEGVSKKEAQQQASREALEYIAQNGDALKNSILSARKALDESAE